MTISLIAAHDLNGVIGYNNDMPWGMAIKSDLKWFKQHTLNQTVVMGNNTFKSLNNQPLPNRKCIIITSNEYLYTLNKPYLNLVFSDIGIVEKLNDNNENIWIIGGQSLYERYISCASYLYITKIHHKFDGDTFFPKYDMNDYDTVYSEDVYDIYALTFMILKRKNLE